MTDNWMRIGIRLSDGQGESSKIVRLATHDNIFFEAQFFFRIHAKDIERAQSTHSKRKPYGCLQVLSNSILTSSLRLSILANGALDPRTPSFITILAKLDKARLDFNTIALVANRLHASTSWIIYIPAVPGHVCALLACETNITRDSLIFFYSAP